MSIRTSRRKRIVLSISEKLEILDKLEQHMPLRQLAKEYGVGKSTVHGIKKSSKELRDFAQKTSSRVGPPRKSMRKSTYKELDEALIQWYNENKQNKILDTQTWCNQAKYFFKELGLEGDFSASNGWFQRFKQRYGIKLNTDKQDEVPSQFCEMFREFVESENLCFEQIYNADATNVFWKTLPTSTFDDELKFYKDYKEKVTILCCANAAGTHKVNICVVGKNSIENSNNLSVNYFMEKSGMIDNDIFSTWFHTCFVPEVCEHLRTKDLPLKVVLLLKKPISRAFSDFLMTSDCQVFIKSLPSSIEPMDIYVIPALKIKYKSITIQNLINEHLNVKQFWFNLSLLDCVHNVVKAWDMVEATTLKNAWIKIFEQTNYIKEEVDILFSELVENLKSIDGYEFITEETLEEWYESDLRNAVGKVRKGFNTKQMSQTDLNVEDNITAENVQVIPHSSALEWIENLISYAELQEDIINSDKDCLKRLRHQIQIKNRNQV